MASIEVRPLVVVREHRAGFFSAFPAFEPAKIAYADARDKALDELRLYLGERFLELPPDEVQKFVLPEAAEVRHIAVRIPRQDRPRSERARTPIDIAVIELASAGGRWLLLPSLGHVMFVAEDALSELEERVRAEVIRVSAARELGGADYLDLLPTASFELERLRVELEPKDRRPAPELVLGKKRKAARELCAQIGRELLPLRHRVLGRDVASLRALLDAPERTSLVLIGPEGAGKSALMQAAVATPEPLSRPVYATSGAELVAGQSFLGQLEARVEAVMKAAELLDALLYFEGLDELFAGRPGGHEDVATLIQRYIDGGRVRIVGELTPEQYDRLAHRHVGFFSRLFRFAVAPLGSDDTVRVLEARSEAEKAARRPFLEPGGAALLVDSVERYDPYRALPGKAIAFFEERAAARLAAPAADGSLALGKDDVYIGLGELTGMPEFLLRDEKSLRVDEVEAFLHRRVIGQLEAVRHVAEAVCSVKAGLQPAGKPLATFLFVGPTGVGKTELAKALARFLFGTEERMARFDMSEYMDPFAAERLIRGTDREDGILTRRVREHLFGVLLLDEIEKADPAVFDLLLQVLGEGRLSDARGKVAYFHNFIVIMTSNIGTRSARSVPGFGAGESDGSARFMVQVHDHFRPEFVNRLDRIVSFCSLTRAEIAEVTRVSLERIGSREGFESRHIRIFASAAALAHLAERGFDATYGARGLRRHLEQALVAPIATLVAGLGSRAERVLVAVTRDGEPLDARALEAELSEPSLGEVLARETRTGLVFSALRRPPIPKRDTANVVETSSLRRRARRWLELEPLSELRARKRELEAALAETPSARRRHGFDVVIGEALAERGRIDALLVPLDRAMAELEEIESLLIAAHHDGEGTGLFESEARAAYATIKKRLVPALYARSDAHEIALAVHELDDEKVLHAWLLPLLASLEERGFQTCLHLDRGERAPEQRWPPEKLLRFGPPETPARYLERYGEAGSVRPFENIVVCVRGHAAGALLALSAGRYRYHDDTTFGELLVRVAAPRFALENKDWSSHVLQPNTDRASARLVPLRCEFRSGSAELTKKSGEKLCFELTPDELFRRFEELCFDELVEASTAGSPFEPRRK